VRGQDDGDTQDAPNTCGTVKDHSLCCWMTVALEENPCLDGAMIFNTSAESKSTHHQSDKNMLAQFNMPLQLCVCQHIKLLLTSTHELLEHCVVLPLCRIFMASLFITHAIASTSISIPLSSSSTQNGHKPWREPEHIKTMLLFPCAWPHSKKKCSGTIHDSYRSNLQKPRLETQKNLQRFHFQTPRFHKTKSYIEHPPHQHQSQKIPQACKL